uniref:phosphopyruvate hydratase n=2 Tax=Hanusia phi TaxID=3032 RepID=A0A7S0HG12_9CRYP|mmetsp:Transcript_24402/g.54996  ORF Transcript_24402/g.54996 Transcript_24402/m.54996 type:complete len:574 (+) Transcript_24402:362-2083(+)
MPPPNPFWVQRYLKEHAIDSLLATAVNQAVAARSKDPAASLACFFSKLSKRNGEIVSLKASRVMNQQLEQAIKLTIEVFYNNETRKIATVVGEMTFLRSKEEAPNQEEDEQESPEEACRKIVDRINGEISQALSGCNICSTRECDVRISQLDRSPKSFLSFSIAKSSSYLIDKQLFEIVANSVKKLQREGARALGGGFLLDGKEEEEQEENGKQGEGEGEEEQVDTAGDKEPEITVRLPVPIFPAIAGRSSFKESKLLFNSFWLIGKHDRPMRETVSKMIALYKSLGNTILSKTVQDGEVGSFKPDEAGFYRTSLSSLEEVMQLLQESSVPAGVELGEDVGVVVNLGANNYFVSNTGENGTYTYKPGEEEPVEADKWASWIEQMLNKYPFVDCIEDACASTDYETWRKVREMAENLSPRQVMLLGEELFQDDPDLFRSGVAEGWAMGAVLSPEKLGTLTDLIDYGTIFTLLKPRAQRLVLTSRKGAHAGEIDADVAVGMGCWGLRCCEPSHRSVDELNRLIEIDEHLRDEHRANTSDVALISWEKVFFFLLDPHLTASALSFSHLPPISLCSV